MTGILVESRDWDHPGRAAASRFRGQVRADRCTDAARNRCHFRCKSGLTFGRQRDDPSVRLVNDRGDQPPIVSTLDGHRVITAIHAALQRVNRPWPESVRQRPMPRTPLPTQVQVYAFGVWRT